MSPLVAVTRPELFLEPPEIRPAVKRAGVFLYLDEHEPVLLYDPRHAAEPAAEVVLPVGEVERRRDVDVIAGLRGRAADPETLRALV